MGSWRHVTRCVNLYLAFTPRSSAASSPYGGPGRLRRRGSREGRPRLVVLQRPCSKWIKAPSFRGGAALLSTRLRLFSTGSCKVNLEKMGDQQTIQTTAEMAIGLSESRHLQLRSNIPKARFPTSLRETTPLLKLQG